MSFYLLDHPNPNGQHYYTTRRKPIQIIVIHTAENLPDLNPPDEGADFVARIAERTTRSVSWHSTVDSDTIIPMLPDTHTAWHVRGYNSMGLGIEIATQARRWSDLPQDFSDGLLDQAATVVAEWCKKWALPVEYVSPQQINRGAQGITAHSVLDPTRRSDPGWNTGMWTNFLDRVERKMNGTDRPSFGEPSRVHAKDWRWAEEKKIITEFSDPHANTVNEQLMTFLKRFYDMLKREDS